MNGKRVKQGVTSDYMIKEAQEAGVEPIPAPIDSYVPKAKGHEIKIRYREPIKRNLSIPKQRRNNLATSLRRRQSIDNMNLSVRGLAASANARRMQQFANSKRTTVSGFVMQDDRFLHIKR